MSEEIGLGHCKRCGSFSYLQYDLCSSCSYDDQDDPAYIAMLEEMEECQAYGYAIGEYHSDDDDDPEIFR